MRIVQIYNSNNEEVGLIKTDLTDSELKRAVEIIDDEFDVFDKFELYANQIGRTAKCGRVFVEELVLDI